MMHIYYLFKGEANKEENPWAKRQAIRTFRDQRIAD